MIHTVSTIATAATILITTPSLMQLSLKGEKPLTSEVNGDGEALRETIANCPYHSSNLPLTPYSSPLTA